MAAASSAAHVGRPNLASSTALTFNRQPPGQCSGRTARESWPGADPTPACSMRRFGSRRSHVSAKYLLVICVTALVTGALVLLALNLSAGEKKITREVRHRYAVGDPQFLRAMGVLLGPALVGGNRVHTLLNGEQIFSSMLEAIRSAKTTITFETYIYWSGNVGKAFADALSERARNGVKVHVLLDAVGSQKLDGKSLDEMRSAGVELRRTTPSDGTHWGSSTIGPTGSFW